MQSQFESLPDAILKEVPLRSGFVRPVVQDIGWDEAIAFGRFCAVPRARQLLLEGHQVEIGGRAFDLLMVLLRSKGGLVTKEEIFRLVWPSMVVEECNLRFQIGSLRKALGADGDMIKTIVRRGYMLIVGDAPSPADVLSNDNNAGRSRLSKVSGPAAPQIVLIEDDANVRLSIAGLLKSVGLDVNAFDSVKAFQESCPAHQPQCLVLDVCLPGRSGLDYQADLVRAGVRFPIIFISGHADIQMSVRAMKAGQTPGPT
jgi:DNA-binding response OmpR family regulator